MLSNERCDEIRLAEVERLPYCQIQGITGARIEGVWFDRAAISDEVWAHVSKPKSYRETAIEAVREGLRIRKDFHHWRGMDEVIAMLVDEIVQQAVAQHREINITRYLATGR